MPPNDVEQVDAVVIGSGFGGAVAACRLSQAGFRVLLLERGRRYEANDFPALPDDDRLLPELKRWVWSQDQGLWDIEDLGEIIAVQAAGYGGGSLIYANVHLRPPEGTFDSPVWPAKFRKGALENYYDLAAHMLNVAPVPGEAPFPKTKHLDDVTTTLGRERLRPPLAIAQKKRDADDTSEAQNACIGCGKCCTGCPERAKSSLDLNYLAVAERNGARVRTQCEVTGIHTMSVDEHGNRWKVTYTNHLAAAQVTVSAKYVFVCAGAVGSTRLLKKAVLPDNKHAEAVKKRIGLGYFPNADAAGMVYDTKQDCSPSSGPTITTGTVHWQNDRFFMIQDGGYAPELERLLGVLRAPLWAGRNRTHMAADTEHRGEDTPRQPTPFPGVALVSPLDGMLDAFATGSFAGASPPKIARSIPGFLREIEKPLLLPAVVQATVDRSWRARYAKTWLGKLFKPETALGQALYGLGRDFALWLAGGPEDLGDHALRSVLHGGDLDRNRYASELLNYDASGARRRMLLLAMGQDAAPGALVVDEQSQKLVADLDMYRLMDGYTNQELLMKDIARELGGELRLNPLWSFYGKPITVHSQGGCGMSERDDRGVTDPHGEVRGCPGLFVLDGSILCQSVGVNPTPTILAISELNVLDFIRREKKNAARWPEGDGSAGAREYKAHVEGAEVWRKRADDNEWQLRPKRTKRVELVSEPLGLKFKELFHGYLAETPHDPQERDTEYRLLEIQGRPANPFKLDLEVRCRDLNKFFEDQDHRLELAGKLEYKLPGEEKKNVHVTGFLELLVPRHKRWGLDEAEISAQEWFAGKGTYTTKKGLPQPGQERFMYYHLSLPNDELRLEGYKRVRQDPGIDAWRDTTALFTRFGTPIWENGTKLCLGGRNLRGERKSIDVQAAGVVHVDLTSFLFREIPSFDAGEWQKNNPREFEVTGTVDPARINWAVGKFVAYFFGTLQRVYSPGTADLLDAIYQSSPNGVRHAPPRVRA